MNKNSTHSSLVILIGFLLSMTTSDIYAKSDFTYKKIKDFIPDNYQIFDTASGDFNSDGFRDYIIVLKRSNEGANFNNERPLLLLAGTAKGKFDLVARNDYVVLCANCGGFFGDPYKKVSMNGKFITIEHRVGGAVQWSRVITFRYDDDAKDILLHEDITRSFKKYVTSSDPGIAVNKDDFGNLRFTSYTYQKGFKD